MRYADINEAIRSRRSQKMLAAFGLVSVIEEPILRERMEYDTADHRVEEFFNQIERRGLLALATQYQTKGGD